jgi:hypothetical protein
MDYYGKDGLGRVTAEQSFVAVKAR